MCAPGWYDTHCATKIDYCQNVSCLNNGVCLPLLLGYLCECLGGSYSGQYCQITARRIIILQIVSKSFA